MRKVLFLIFSFFLLIIIAGCNLVNSKTAAAPGEDPAAAHASIAAVGDIMAHMPEIRASYNPQEKKYDFYPFFADISPYLSSSDLTIGNLETTFGGPGHAFSGYPHFSCPGELADALSKAGFNLITTANNHCLDLGTDGIVSTIDRLDEAALAHTGTFRTPAEQQHILFKTVNGIKIAFLAYTYSINGNSLPKDKAYMVNIIDAGRITEEISSARQQGADFIVVCLHFGTEYQRQPNSSQQELVKQLFAAGADIILGSHPHVLEPMEKRTITTPDGTTRDVFVIYSMGNFISNQRDHYKDSGIILKINLEKDLTSGAKKIASVAYLPTWVQRYRAAGKIQYRLLPVEKAIRDYETGQDSLLTKSDYARLKQVWQETTQMMSHSGEGVSIWRDSKD